MYCFILRHYHVDSVSRGLGTLANASKVMVLPTLQYYKRRDIR